jgi:hypothetical protein
LEKEKREGVMDKMSIFFLSIQNRTEEGAHRGDLPAADGGRLGYGGGREWGTQRGGRGRLVPVLTSGWGGLWREIDDGGRSVTRAACGGRRWELRGERE